MKKELICSCVNVDYEVLGIEDVNELIDLVDNAKEISKEEFLENCDLEGKEDELNEYPNDFEFYKNRDIFFIRNSAIEQFFK